MSDNRSTLASISLTRHLLRGAIGFGLVGLAFALTSIVGAAALLIAPLGMVALRGCPTCWIVGLIQTISADRFQRSCTETSCTLRRPHASDSHTRDPGQPVGVD